MGKLNLFFKLKFPTILLLSPCTGIAFLANIPNIFSPQTQRSSDPLQSALPHCLSLNPDVWSKSEPIWPNLVMHKIPLRLMLIYYKLAGFKLTSGDMNSRHSYAFYPSFCSKNWSTYITVVQEITVFFWCLFLWHFFVFWTEYLLMELNQRCPLDWSMAAATVQLTWFLVCC